MRKTVFEKSDLDPLLARLTHPDRRAGPVTPEEFRDALVELLNDEGFFDKLAYAVYKRTP